MRDLIGILVMIAVIGALVFAVAHNLIGAETRVERERIQNEALQRRLQMQLEREEKWGEIIYLGKHVLVYIALVIAIGIAGAYGMAGAAWLFAVARARAAAAYIVPVRPKDGMYPVVVIVDPKTGHRTVLSGRMDATAINVKDGQAEQLLATPGQHAATVTSMSTVEATRATLAPPEGGIEIAPAILEMGARK